LNSFGFDGDNCPFVYGSALAAIEDKNEELGKNSILRLLDALDTYIELPKRDMDQPFLMPVDSKVSIPGRGTVIVGTVTQGMINRGDAVEVVGRGRKVKTNAIDIHIFGESQKLCEAGDHVGLLCRGVKANMVQRGMYVATPGYLVMSNRYTASMYLMSKQEGGRKTPISANFLQVIYSETWSMGVRIDVPQDQGGLLMPGDHGLVHLTLPKHHVMSVGQTFTIREQNKTIASGVISEKLSPAELDTKHKGIFSTELSEKYKKYVDEDS